MKDYYAILGVRHDANYDTIKRAFRQLAFNTHPDKGSSADKFQEVHEAWLVLSDETKRANYDTLFLQDEQVIVNEIIPFAEFEKRNEGDSYYHYCRCGGVFEDEVTMKIDLVECSECSLVCRIEYS
ncbi:hypothetical protein WA171_003540 [Blastocystis sp. BT1]